MVFCIIMVEEKKIIFKQFSSFEEAEAACSSVDHTGDNFWDASMRLLDMWFLMRGLDPEKQRIDRSVFIKTTAPWSEPGANVYGKDFN